MENKNAVQPKLSGSIMPYAVTFGIIMIVELVVMYILKPDPIKNGWVGTVNNIFNFFIFPALFITLACNNFKKSNGGYITFGQSLKIGVGLCALAAFIYAIFYFIFNLIFPEFIPEAIEQIKRVTVNNRPDISSQELEMSMSIIEKTMSPYVAGPISIVMYSFFGLIISLVVGAIVKKENPYGSFAPAEETNNAESEQ